MNARKIILIFLLLPLIFNACKEDGIMTPDSSVARLSFPTRGYISTSAYDSLSFNSIFYSGGEIAEFRVPIHLTGAVSPVDREYTMKIITEETRGLTRGTHYTFDEKQMFKGGRVIDSAIVRLNVPLLKSDKVEGRVVIELVPNENFERGFENHQSIIVAVSGKGLSAVPNFWTYYTMSDYGGIYSHLKAEKFIELNGITSDAWRAANKTILYAYAKKTYDWFNDNPTYDNGERVYFKGTIQY